MRADLSPVAIAFTTSGRPHAARRFVAAARLHFPDPQIYVASEQGDDPAMSGFYKEHRVQEIRGERGVGLAALRNRLVSEVREDFVLLCDDSHILYRETSFTDAVAVLAGRPEVGVVGGRVFDLDAMNLRDRHDERFLHHDARNGILVSLPIRCLAPLLRQIAGVRYYLCDAVGDLALFRRSMFNGGAGWDERLDAACVSEDFYLALKSAATHRVAYLPGMVAFRRAEPPTEGSDAGRAAAEVGRCLSRKWGLSQYVEAGTGGVHIDGLGTGLTAGRPLSRVFAEIDAPPGRRRARDASGRSHWSSRAASPVNSAEGSNDSVTAGSARAAPVMRFDPAEWSVRCRYNPLHAPESDLIVWCAAAPMAGAGSLRPPLLDLRARWYSADGRVLVWEMGGASLELSSDGEWLPVWFEVPLIPPSSSFVRFDLVAASVRGAAPICCGFLLPTAAVEASAMDALDVLALAMAGGPPAAAPAAPGVRDQLSVSLAAERIGPVGGGLLLLPLEPVSEISALYFKNWPGLGKHVLTARLPEGASDAPRAVAVPDMARAAGTPELLVHYRTGRTVTARVRQIRGAGGPPPTAGDRDQTMRHKRSGEQGVAVVLTSCGRQDLLERTLDSFFAFNSAALAQFIVVEDGVGAANAPLIPKYQTHGITWLATETRVGQIAAIDYAYAHVDQPFIFHMEDDWEFYRAGFVENSLKLLQALPDCLQVWLRAVDDTNDHPLSPEVETAQGVPFRRLASNFRRVWHGFSFNPGLRRNADYSLLGKYGWFAASEDCLSEIYKQLGFFAAILADADGIGYVRHLGWGRTVATAGDKP